MDAEERKQYLAQEKIDNKITDQQTQERMARGKDSGWKIMIDCEFEKKMSDRENKSLISQFKYIYNRIKKSDKEVSVLVTGYGGRLKELAQYHNIQQWPFNWYHKSLQ